MLRLQLDKFDTLDALAKRIKLRLLCVGKPQMLAWPEPNAMVVCDDSPELCARTLLGCWRPNVPVAVLREDLEHVLELRDGQHQNPRRAVRRRLPH